MTDPVKVLHALSSSQQRLADLVSGLEPADLERATSDHGWTVAEVLGHLGSQSEIFTLFVDAGLNDKEPPSNEAFGPIWDAWNAKSPATKATDALAADASFLEHVGSLDADQLRRFELSLFGMHVDAARLLGMRLGEHALHSWDVEVLFDEKAVLAPDATELLVDGTRHPRRARREARGAAPVDQHRHFVTGAPFRPGHRRRLARTRGTAQTAHPDSN